MSLLQDGLISYGRADSKDFAIRLKQDLQTKKAGLKIWLDLNDIPAGVDYQKQIDDSIDKTDNFLFIISPHAVNSAYCALEINQAVARRKRIIPLMHVEEISYETWQRRYPGQSDQDWETFKGAGRHTSEANMPGVIQKLNWIFFREKIDDYEASLQQLLALFDRDRDYVHQHTVLFNQAQKWEDNHRRSRYLLVEESLQAAEAWLKTSFEDRQPPCLPTKLHCRFISESRKNSQGGFTDVFLTHAEEDKAAHDDIYEMLTRAGLTVWSSWQDIQKGIPFKQAIERGVEAADTLVYLVSASSLTSSYCQEESRLAQHLHKRIIPVLVNPIDVQALPPDLSTLQIVDLAGDPQSADYDQNTRAFLNALTETEEVNYYKTHKLLLVKALKWHRQYRNPSILLRGYALQQTEAWLQGAKLRDRNPPLPVQTEFVQASRDQPADIELNAFITSDAKDLEFARKLNEKLQIQEIRTWFRADETAPGEDYSTQIREAIEQAQNCIFILSREGITDPELLEELRLANTLSKRIIAVPYRNLDWSKVPEVLTQSQKVIFSAEQESFEENFEILSRIIRSHPDHVRDHTRLLIRALEWVQSQDDSLLLRKKEFIKAENWLAAAQDQIPKPSDLQRNYIRASRDLMFRRIKLRTALGLATGVSFAVLVARISGLLLGAELAAYDFLLTRRFNEPQDDRFLIVAVDSNSGDFIRDGLEDGTYDLSIGTIPDDALNEVITKLQQQQPSLIGLDFFRDFTAQPSVETTLRETDNLIGVCKVGIATPETETPDRASADLAGEKKILGVEKADEIPIERTGFADFVSEPNRGNFLRRHLLMQGSDPGFCNTSVSFSLLLAERYLAQANLPTDTEGQALSADNIYTNPMNESGRFDRDRLQFTNGPGVPSLHSGFGPYPNFGLKGDFFNGYQTLLNFRTVRSERRAKDPTALAPVIPLSAFLTESFPENFEKQYGKLTHLVKDRIVLIGYTDRTDRNADYWNTPYGEMPGVFLQAQMTSQLISAVLDGRPLMRWWPFGGQVLWSLVWALGAALVVRQFIRVPVWATLLVGAGVLGGTCYGAVIFNALLLPLVPPLIAFSASAAGVAFLGYRFRNP